jgi:WD40 repeat protein
LTLSGMNDEVLAVAVDAKGEQVVTSGFETQLNWWDAKTAERVKRIGGPGVASHELAIAPKGAVCAVAGGDGSLRFYKPGGDLIRAARAESAVFAVALDSSGKRAASGAADGTVKLWDVADARLLLTLWSGNDDNWLSIAPEGFVAGSESALAKAAWKASGKPVMDAKLLAPLKDAGQLGQAAQGQKIGEPVWK